MSARYPSLAAAIIAAMLFAATFNGLRIMTQALGAVQ